MNNLVTVEKAEKEFGHTLPWAVGCEDVPIHNVNPETKKPYVPHNAEHQKKLDAAKTAWLKKNPDWNV